MGTAGFHHPGMVPTVYKTAFCASCCVNASCCRASATHGRAFAVVTPRQLATSHPRRARGRAAKGSARFFLGFGHSSLTDFGVSFQNLDAASCTPGFARRRANRSILDVLEDRAAQGTRVECIVVIPNLIATHLHPTTPCRPTNSGFFFVQPDPRPPGLAVILGADPRAAQLARRRQNGGAWRGRSQSADRHCRNVARARQGSGAVLCVSVRVESHRGRRRAADDRRHSAHDQGGDGGARRRVARGRSVCRNRCLAPRAAASGNLLRYVIY
jgi:hypothetical protein